MARVKIGLCPACAILLRRARDDARAAGRDANAAIAAATKDLCATCLSALPPPAAAAVRARGSWWRGR